LDFFLQLNTAFFFCRDTAWFYGPCQPGHDADRARPCQSTHDANRAVPGLFRPKIEGAVPAEARASFLVPSLTTPPPAASRRVPPAENRSRARFLRVSNAQRLLSRPDSDGFWARVPDRGTQARICSRIGRPDHRRLALTIGRAHIPPFFFSAHGD
jgi:hypothetical protein